MNNNDIKSHTPNNTIKTPSDDIKGVSQKIKDVNAEKQKKDRNKHSIETQTTNKFTNSAVTIGATSGVVTSVLNKPIAKKLSKKTIESKKNYLNYKNSIKDDVNSIKSDNTNTKREYKQARKSIKDNDSLDKQKKKQAREVERNNYKSTKQLNNSKLKVYKDEKGAKLKEYIKAKFKESGNKVSIFIVAALIMLIVIITILYLFISPLGIIFTDDDDDGVSHTLKSAVVTMNNEFASKLIDIENSNTFDEVSISNDGCKYTIANWQDILAIWDINQYGKSIIGVIDDSQLENIRTTCWDMITISHYVEPTYKTELDEYGNEFTKTVKTLYIDVHYKSIDEMKKEYEFDRNQIIELDNLVNSKDFMEVLRNISITDDMSGPIIGNGQFIYPTISTHISAGFPYYDNGSYHGGVDFPVPVGSPIYATYDGTVATVRKRTDSYGYYIIIDHGNGLSTLYAHNSELLVEEGQLVKQGETIALSGSTGNSTGPHCHFEVRSYGNRVDPMQYLK